MRTLFLLIGCFVLLSANCFSQEEMPEYPGGYTAMIKFIQDSLVYPDSARKAGIEGKVYLKFVVDTTGKVADISVLKSPSPLLNYQAISVLEKMPLWKPGRMDGKAVPVKYNLPLTFSNNPAKKDK